MIRGFWEIGVLRKVFDEGMIEEFFCFDMYLYYCWVLGGDWYIEDELYVILF